MAAILIPRGEFSIVIAGLASTATFATDIQALTITYVILTTIIASTLVRYVSLKPTRL
jgi:CPA2 family monovalent cation:H+ antiporter-2